MKRRYFAVPIVALAFALTRVTQAEPTAVPTALNLAYQGDNYVGIQSKDRIVRITSDKSMGTLAPTVWHVVFYDPNSPFRTVEVKFGSGQEMDVSHPVLRPFEPAARESEVLDRARLKIDSDGALNIAAGQPALKSLTLRASKLTLTYSDGGPIWKVQLWAAKPDGNDADVGTVIMSAIDGTVTKAGLHPGKAE
jgi:hypothetical protein